MWGCVPKDFFQGRAYCPHAQASKGWISPHRAPVWERTLTKLGIGSTAFPYAWIHFLATPGYKNIFMSSDGKGLRWELLVLTHEQESSYVCYRQESPGTRSFMDCDGAMWGASKWRLNPVRGTERYFWVTHVYCQHILLGPSAFFSIYLCAMGWQRQHWQQSRGKRSDRVDGEGITPGEEERGTEQRKDMG